MATTNKSHDKDYEEFMRLRRKYRVVPNFEACSDAFEVLRFDTIDLSLIAPITPETHDGVRVNGVSQHSVNEFKSRIEDGLYDPIGEEPPCITELPKDSSAYRKGYRYRMADGHTRREAHVQLDMETIEVAVVKFHDACGESADYWRLVFMAEKNNPKKRKFHQEPTSAKDEEQIAMLVTAAASKKVDTTSVGEEDASYKYVEKRTAEIAKDLGIVSVSGIASIRDSVVRAVAKNDPNVLKYVVHHYTDYYVTKYTDTFCEEYGYESDNVIVRPFYKKDEMLSRDDYNNFKFITEVAMDNIDNLKDMAFLGRTGPDCKTEGDVYIARKRKTKLIPSMIDWIDEMHKFYSVKKNRDAVLNMPMYWMSQTYNDAEVGEAFKVNPTTGKMLTTKKG